MGYLLSILIDDRRGAVWGRAALRAPLLAFLAACGAPEETEVEVETAEQALFAAGLVTSKTIVLAPRGDEADVYAVVPPPRLRKVFEDRFPMVVLLQGGLVPKEAYSELARKIALQGFVVIVPNRFNAFVPGSPPLLLTDQLVVLDALAALEDLDEDPVSPFYRIIDTSRSALTGHSLGGAVGLFVIDGGCTPPFCFGGFARPASLRAGVFYGSNLVQDGVATDVDTSAVPTTLIQGTLDGVAVPAEAEQTFREVLDGTKVLITIEGANHFGLTDTSLPQGANPDPIPQTLSQSVSIRLIALWTGRALRAFVKEERLANFWIFESGGSFDGRVTVEAER